MSQSRMEKYHDKNNKPVKNRSTKGKPRKSKKPKKRSKASKIILTSLLLVFLFILGVSFFYIFNILNGIKGQKISDNHDDLGINKELVQQLQESGKNKNITNIALFGTDERDSSEKGRSDAVMVLTIDTEHNKLKLSSLMRDSYVDIDGHGKDKLNHAYAFGGPQLAIKTINKNFNLNITDYATVNFYHLQDIIDVIGGIEIDVKKEEIEEVNKMMNELAFLGKYKPPFIKNPGLQTLNGKQALAYTRTRNIGNGDFDRAARQRTVLNALFNKVTSAGVTKYPAIINSVLPMVETSLSKAEILKIGTDVLTSGLKDLEQERFPVDGYFKDGGQTINGVWYLVYDIKQTSKQMYDYIFNDIKPQPKK